MVHIKHIVSILLLLTAVICILNAALFGNIMPISTSNHQLAQQSISSSTAYICILYGLSTWLYHSNYSEPRQDMRYVFLAMLIIMILGNLIALVTAIKTHFFGELRKAVELPALFTDFEYICRTLTAVLFVITLLLLFIIFALEFRTTIKKRRHAHPLESRRDTKEGLP